MIFFLLSVTRMKELTSSQKTIMNYQDSTRIVIKVGSALIAPSGAGCNAKHTLPIARFIHQCQEDGKQVILVSSGSVAAGQQHIPFYTSQPSLAQKQAMAAIGQNAMMANWMRFFDNPCAQILMTHADLHDREGYINIRNTINELLTNNVLPIVNENDSVATEELKVGDNDRLAAMVAILTNSDLFLICSDVDGLFTSDPNIDKKAQHIPLVEEINSKIFALAGDTTNHLAIGGMRTKLEAAIKATSNGIATILFQGSLIQNFESFIKGSSIGTLFKAQSKTLSDKKHWVKHTLNSKGVIEIDAGAVEAILNNGASLLSIGISRVTGEFERGDAVDIHCQQTGNIIAKGLCQYSRTTIEQIKGQHSENFEKIIGYIDSDVIVKRDDLVLV